MNGVKDELIIYKTICEPKFVDLKTDIAAVHTLVKEVKEAVFNGLRTDVNYVKAYIDATMEKKKRRLTNRELLMRSLAIGVGGGIFTGIAVAIVKFLLHI
jgi:asparagine synthetase A